MRQLIEDVLQGVEDTVSMLVESTLMTLQMYPDMQNLRAEIRSCTDCSETICQRHYRDLEDIVDEHTEENFDLREWTMSEEDN